MNIKRTRSKGQTFEDWVLILRSGLLPFMMVMVSLLILAIFVQCGEEPTDPRPSPSRKERGPVGGTGTTLLG